MSIFSSASSMITSIFTKVEQVTQPIGDMIDISSEYTGNRKTKFMLLDRESVATDTVVELANIHARLEDDDNLKAKYEEIRKLFD